MSHIQASLQVVLVVENANYITHAAAALQSCGGLNWVEVDDCVAAAERLESHPADLVLVLLQPTSILSGLTLLRHVWQGPLICLCEDIEDAVCAVEAAHGFAILPPFAMRQIRSALRLLLPQIELPANSPDKLLANASGEPVSEFPDPGERVRLADQLHAEQALHESARRREQAQRMEAVGRLAGGIAHDFNNLLTVISSYSDLSIRRLEDDHVVARYVEQIRKASATAAKLTQQLLAFSRRQVLQPHKIVCNETVEEMSVMVQSLLGSGIELRMQLDPSLGQVEADSVQLQQVLLNLIVNAKDAMPDGGLINIETRNFELDARYAMQFPKLEPGAYVRLTVADTGSGMDAMTLARIYEPFFTTKPKGQGTGLGLATVYGIVQQNGGHIRVYSEVGKGTTFHVYLPRADKASDVEVAVGVEEDIEELSSLYGQETILLVGDEPSVRELATTILQEAGYRLLTAGTPEEALRLGHEYQGKIDLLLTDVVMPRMTGREVATRLARQRPKIPVVYMSGYAKGVIAFQQLVEREAYLVEKPFYPNDLLRKVRLALEQLVGRQAPMVGEVVPVLSSAMDHSQRPPEAARPTKPKPGR